MKLCEYCVETVLKSKESWDYHRCYTCLKGGSEWTVKRSGETERCLFCSTLRRDIESTSPELQAHNGPIYRWNIRSLAKIRESLETVVVTFRQIPTTKIEGNVSIEEAKLPERTFYFFSEEDIAPLPTIENLGPSTDPAKNGGHQIKSWIDTCNSTHTGCLKGRKARSSTSAQFVPTRLLDIRGPAKSSFKVIETNTTPARSPYATLSHCWGTIKFVTLMPENKESYMREGVPWDKLTKNFRDAIEVVRFLGIEYIWIDSLCIVQGPGGDFDHEGPLMHLVYRNSYCNISIVDSQDSTGGVFRERNPSDVAPVRYQSQEESAIFGTRTWGVIADDLWETELLQTKLYVRGWVFQERMLSPRILHFAHQQIFWDCPSLSACEALPSGLPTPMDGTARPDRHWRGRLQEPEEKDGPLVGANDDSIDEFWRTAVQKYTSCDLKMGSDKLVAMWGIAKLIRDARNVEYGAGLWERNLEDQLTWRVANCTLRERPSYSNKCNLKRDIPSWSWASMDGRIEVADQLTDVSHYTVTNHSGSALGFNFAKGRRPMAATSSDLSLDAQPKLESKSLEIQGHVGRALLHQDHVSKIWFLRIEESDGIEIEAYPDLIPDLNKPEDHSPFFVVLSAKQRVRSLTLEADAVDIEDHEQRTGNEVQDTYDEDDSDYAKEIVYSGVGILMKQVRNDHFHRTGAFSFRNISGDVFGKLQTDYQKEGLLVGMFDTNLGRKFWLE